MKQWNYSDNEEFGKNNLKKTSVLQNVHTMQQFIYEFFFLKQKVKSKLS